MARSRRAGKQASAASGQRTPASGGFGPVNPKAPALRQVLFLLRGAPAAGAHGGESKEEAHAAAEDAEAQHGGGAAPLHSVAGDEVARHAAHTGGEDGLHALALDPVLRGHVLVGEVGNSRGEEAVAQHLGKLRNIQPGNTRQQQRQRQPQRTEDPGELQPEVAAGAAEHPREQHHGHQLDDRGDHDGRSLRVAVALEERDLIHEVGQCGGADQQQDTARQQQEKPAVFKEKLRKTGRLAALEPCLLRLRKAQRGD